MIKRVLIKRWWVFEHFLLNLLLSMNNKNKFITDQEIYVPHTYHRLIQIIKRNQNKMDEGNT